MAGVPDLDSDVRPPTFAPGALALLQRVVRKADLLSTKGLPDFGGDCLLPHPYVRIAAGELYQTDVCLEFDANPYDSAGALERTLSNAEVRRLFQINAIETGPPEVKLHEIWPVALLSVDVVHYDTRGLQNTCFLTIESTRPKHGAPTKWTKNSCFYPATTANRQHTNEQNGTTPLLRDSNEYRRINLFSFNVAHFSSPRNQVLLTMNYEAMAKQMAALQRGQHAGSPSRLVPFTVEAKEVVPMKGLPYVVAHSLQHLVQPDVQECVLSTDGEGKAFWVCGSKLEDELRRLEQTAAQAEHCVWRDASFLFRLVPHGTWKRDPTKAAPSITLRLAWVFVPSHETRLAQ